MFAHLVSLSKYSIAMSGTLCDGKCSELFSSFFKLFPSKLKELGFEYGSPTDFIEAYGRRKVTITTYIDEEKYTRTGTKISRSQPTELPGISPVLYTNFLCGSMLSRKIDDMGFNMPSFKSFKHVSVMPKEMANVVKSLSADFKLQLQKTRGRGCGNYISTLVGYPDRPLAQAVPIGEDIVVVPDLCNELLPKEKKLIETMEIEKSQGRKMLIYCEYTGDKKDGFSRKVDERVCEILTKSGFKVARLRSNKPPKAKVEEWINKRVEEGYDAIICNPILVETGLNLIDFPSIYFYEISYKAKTVRQAEKRSYRPHQTRECRVYYSYYKDSLQENAIHLIARKRNAALQLEGVITDDILSQMTSDGDSITKELTKILEGVLKDQGDCQIDFEEGEFAYQDEAALDDMNFLDDSFMEMF